MLYVGGLMSLVNMEYIRDKTGLNDYIGCNVTGMTKEPGKIIPVRSWVQR